MGIRSATLGAAIALIVGASAVMAHDTQIPRVERVAPCGMQIRSAAHCVDVQALAQALNIRRSDDAAIDVTTQGLARQVAAQRDEIARLQSMVTNLEGQIALLQMRR